MGGAYLAIDRFARKSVFRPGFQMGDGACCLVVLRGGTSAIGLAARDGARGDARGKGKGRRLEVVGALAKILRCAQNDTGSHRFGVVKVRCGSSVAGRGERWKGEAAQGSRAYRWYR